MDDGILGDCEFGCGVYASVVETGTNIRIETDWTNQCLATSTWYDRPESLPTTVECEQ